MPFVGQVLWAIETLVMGIFRGIQGAIEGFKEGGIIGGLIGFLKGFMKGAFEGFIGSILDLLKDGVAWILDKFGFSDLAGILRDFSFVETFNQTIDLLFGTIGNLFGWVKSIFVSDDEVVDGKETMSFWERMKETITKVWDAIKSFGIWVVKMAGFLSWGFFKLGELLEDPVVLMRAKSKGIMGAIKSFKSLFAQFMAGFFFVIYLIQGIVVTIWKSITGAIDGFKKGWNKTEGGWFKKLLGGIWGGIWGFLNGFFKRRAMMGFLTLILDGLKDATAFLLQGLSFLLKSLGKWTAIGFGKLFDKVFEIPKKILVWILQSLGFENMAKIVKDFSFQRCVFINT